MAYEFEADRRVVYGEGATFVSRCRNCSRFVKPPATMRFGSDAQPVEPHTECARCGPTAMLFEGHL